MRVDEELTWLPFQRSEKLKDIFDVGRNGQRLTFGVASPCALWLDVNDGAPTSVRWGGLACAPMASTEIAVAKGQLLWAHGRLVDMAKVLAH
jgi:hypothetical protein